VLLESGTSAAASNPASSCHGRFCYGAKSQHCSLQRLLRVLPILTARVQRRPDKLNPKKARRAED